MLLLRNDDMLLLRNDDMQGRLAALDDMHHTSCGDDIPLLSQWIRKKFRFGEISRGSEPLEFSAKKEKEAFVTYPKGQFFKNTVYLERGMPYLRLCLQMQCL